VLLSLIQVRKQQAVFLLKFFCCAHTDSVTQCASFVTIINLRAQIITVAMCRRIGSAVRSNRSINSSNFSWRSAQVSSPGSVEGCQTWFLVFVVSLASISSTGEMPRRLRIQFEGAIYQVMASASPSPTGR
jgi:hypothetical protein